MRLAPLSLVIVSIAFPVLADEAIHIGSQRELFVDGYLIEKLDGARLTLHHPQPREVALRFDQPWEGAFASYD